MYRKVFLALTIILWGMDESRAQLVINELMQSNVDCLMDDINEFPDSWVELYNAGTTAVELSQYKLGSSEDAAEAWSLPAGSIGAGRYAVVYCDKEAHGMHADFRLESGKGAAVYLFRGDAVADNITGLKKQPAPNVAYGRQADGGSVWGYQQTPTPGKPNCGLLCTKVLGEPVFSEPGRVVTGRPAISLTLSLPGGTPAGTEIRVTYDGSEPTRNSALYTAPITVRTTTAVRAKLFCEGYLSPRSTTHSYIFFPRVLTLPVVSIVTDSKYFYDNTVGIYVDGTYQSGKKNYEFDWRRPVNLEYFAGENRNSDINQLCETRIQGGATRPFLLKSLAVYANKRFGVKRFSYEFFPDQRPGLTEYKSIVLRNAGNDFDYLYMRDAVIQRTMAKHADLDWQAWRPVIVYINGVYKGILNIRERSNEDNIYTNYGGLEDIDMIENWQELKEGDRDHYDRFRAFYAEHGHTMAEYEKWMDCKEFINLMAMNLYYNNQDFPGNNFVMWRPRTADGRWRFIAKDTDFGLGLYGSPATYKTLEWFYNPNYDSNRAWANGYEHTRLFRRLMEDADFSREFIDRTAIYMGDFMNERGTREVWDPMYELIKAEYPYHRRLVNQWWPDYDEELSAARSWLSARTESFYQQLADYYKLGHPVRLLINHGFGEEGLDGLQVCFNGVELSRATFDGRFFAGRDIMLKGTAADGKEVTGWDVVQVATDGSVTTGKIAGAQYGFSMPLCRSLSVTAVVGNADGINSLPVRSWSWSISGQRLALSGVAANTKVALYDLQGILLRQVVATGADILLPLSGNRRYVLKVGAETVKL